MSANPPPTRQRTSRPSINLSELASNPDQLENLTLSRPESLEDRLARIQQEKARTYFDMGKEGLIYLAGVGGVGFIFWFCLGIFNNAAASPDDKKWAQTVIAGIVTAVVGYLIGKSKS